MFPSVRTGAIGPETVGLGLRGIKEVPTTSVASPGANDRVFPDMTIAVPPGERVCVPITKADCEFSVIAGTGYSVGVGPNGILDVLGSNSETAVPSIVLTSPGKGGWILIVESELARLGGKFPENIDCAGVVMIGAAGLSAVCCPWFVESRALLMRELIGNSVEDSGGTRVWLVKADVLKTVEKVGLGRTDGVDITDNAGPPCVIMLVAVSDSTGIFATGMPLP